MKYENVFSKSSGDLGITDRVRHRINTGSAQPIKKTLRRQPFIGAEKEEIQKMLEKWTVEPSNISRASPILIVSRRMAQPFLVDYRKLNDVTVKDGYPLPRVDECLDALAGS